MKRTQIEKILWGIMLLLIFFVTTILFYCQAIELNGLYFSDLPTHISVALEGRGYSVNRIAMTLFYGIADGPVGVACYLGGVIVLTVIAAYFLFVTLDKVNHVSGYRSLYKWAAMTLIFMISLYVPHIYEHFYWGTMGLQAWHNSTYIVMRLFALLTLILYFKVDSEYLIKINGIHMFLFMLVLTLTTMVKPNFLVGFAPMMALGLLWDLITSEKNIQNLGKIILFGSMVFPSLIALLFQNQYLYGGEEATSSIVFSFGTWYLQNGHPILKFVLVMLFPMLVLLWNLRHLKKQEWYVKVWILWFVEFAVYVCFMESGERATHGNFGWGLAIGNFFLFLSSIYMFVNNIRELAREKKWKLNGKLYVGILSALWMWHLISGLYYFLILLSGRDYWI